MMVIGQPSGRGGVSSACVPVVMMARKRANESFGSLKKPWFFPFRFAVIDRTCFTAGCTGGGTS